MNTTEIEKKTCQTHQNSDYDDLILQLVSNYQAMVDQISTTLDTMEQQHWHDNLAS